MESNNYNLLIRKLDLFIRKYYRNQVFKGLFLSLTIFLFYYISVAVAEYLGNFSTSVRTAIYYFSISLFVVVVANYIVMPLLHFFQIGKTISHKQAAGIISKHFTSVKDKLLNTLELADSMSNSSFSPQLLLASIDQRIQQIKPIPFESAVKFRDNMRYMKMLGIAILIGLAIYFIAPTIFSESTARIINHDEQFVPKAPFSFVLLNDSLAVERGSDFEVELRMEGDFVPDEVAIEFGGNVFYMDKQTKSKFRYLFKNINNSLKIRFQAGGYQSLTHEISVLPTPLIFDFELTIVPPSYTGITAKTYQNVGDATVPYGSKLSWNFKTENTDSLKVSFNDSLTKKAIIKDELFFVNHKLMESSVYKVSAYNEFFAKETMLKYFLNVIPDMFPAIDLVSLRDSASMTTYYFNGKLTDDYGFTKLLFKCEVENKPGILKQISIPIEVNNTSQEFYFAFDFAELSLNSSQKISYYFQVWDNDGISGAKSTKSSVYEFKVPSRSELQKASTEANESVQSKVAQSQELVQEIMKDISKLREEMVNNNSSSWEKTKMLNEIMKKQTTLEQVVKQLKDEFKNNNQMVNTFTEEEKEMREKQKEIEALLESLMDEEMKKLMEEIKELQENFDPKKLNELSEKMEMSYDELQKQLDRELELLKQFEVEQKVNSTIDRLEKLSEEQDKLSEKTDEKMESEEELKQQQQEQKEEFEDIRKDYEDAVKKNEELSNPMDMEKFEEEMSDIEQEMEQSQQNIENGKQQKSSENQKKSSKQMKSLAKQMQSMMEQNAMEQNAENIDDLRQILDNLIDFSFGQENVLTKLKGLDKRNPQFLKLLKDQKNLADDFEVINDSLLALAKRTTQIAQPVNKELATINRNIKSILDDMEERWSRQIYVSQQTVMTAANNLALLLSEALDQMQNQSGSGMPGAGKPKPGKGNMPSLSEMRKQHESYKKQLEQMMQMMKDGKMGKGQMSKQLAKMLAEQEMMNKMLQDLQNGSTISPETSKKLHEIRKMIEQNERDIVNKQITPEMIKRQQKIETRLLEAENAENERETDKKRKSTEGKDLKPKNPKDIFKKQKENSIFIENLKTTDIKMINFYKSMYGKYLLKLDEE